jgi:hypothetical protein
LLEPAEAAGDVSLASELFGSAGRIVDFAGRTFHDVDGREVS